MTEETEGQEAGAEASGAGVDPAAMALALGGADRDAANAYLKDQRAFIADQRHHLAAQFQPQLRQLLLGVWEKRLGLLLRIATAFTGLAIAAGIAFLIWDAAHSNRLLIEPFSVPPDLAQRGLTGQAVAAELLDRLAVMQAQTLSQRAPATYANSWSQQDIKLDIPETGLSLAELDEFLRDRLGHDTHITGEIVRTASGLSLTARAGVDGAEVVTTQEAGLDAAVQRLSESVYKLTQPFRYGIYLASRGRHDEALPVFEALARTGPAQERSWGYIGWSVAVEDSAGTDERLRIAQLALDLDPENAIELGSKAAGEEDKSEPERAVGDNRKMILSLRGSGQQQVRAELIPAFRERTKGFIDLETGAFHDAAQELAHAVLTGGAVGLLNGISPDLAWAQTGEHDLAAARTTIADPDNGSGVASGSTDLLRSRARMQIASATGDWAGVVAESATVEATVREYPGTRALPLTTTAPLLAYAQAKLGDVTGAEATIAVTPAYCYACLIARGRIAGLNGRQARMDFWFTRAIATAPSVPLAEDEWGAALLDRGDPVAAIAKFTIANQKGPHFADPLEMWGEALMKQNRSDRALAKFAEAEKYAPNWGRLHLKWGEALGYSGRKDDAQKQFALAAGLDLSAADKVELARQPLHG